MLKKYLVESRKDFTENFDNYIFDYVQAHSEIAAVTIYKEILLNMGAQKYDIETYEYKATEVE